MLQTFLDLIESLGSTIEYVIQVDLLANQIYTLSAIAPAIKFACTKLIIRYNGLHIRCGDNQCQPTAITVLFIPQALYIISEWGH